MPLRIVELDMPLDKKIALAGYLRDTFDKSVKARREQNDSRLTRWINNYAAKPRDPIRTTPFFKASNFVPQLIRMHTDVLTARVLGIILGTKPFWMPKSFISDMPHEWLEALSLFMDQKSMYEIKLPKIIDQATFRAFKTGTFLLKVPWFERAVSSRYGSGPGFTEEEYAVAYPKVMPIPYDDFFVFPITAPDLDEVEVKFHRLRMTKETVQYKKSKGEWDGPACDKLINSPDSEAVQSAARKAQAQEAGIALTEDVDRPFTAVEAWLDYELTPGKLYSIVVVFNPKVSGAESILRAYYKYFKRDLDCFIDGRPLPREDSFYGYAIPEVLEQSQEEQAQIHNARRDSNSIMNIPGWKKRKYADVGKPSEEWYPGKVWELENMDDLEPVQFQGLYNDMIQEEEFVLGLADRYTGVGPPMQGFGAGALEGKRGIYNSQGTMSMLSEGNKRLDIYIKRFRYPYHKLGRCIYESYRDFNPAALEFLIQKTGKTFDLKSIPSELQGVFFEIGASDASANKEIERSGLMLMANTMAGYYRQIVEAASMVAQIPPDHPLREIIIQTLEGAGDMAARILFAFDMGDRKRLVPDVRTILAGGAQSAATQAEQSGVPVSEEALSTNRLRDLAGSLTALTGAARGRNGTGS